MAADLTQHDARERRCPMLGHQVPFSYCRAPGRDLPCHKVFDCWWELFDVAAFIREHFSEGEIARILAAPKDKTVTILEMIEKARSARRQGS